MGSRIVSTLRSVVRRQRGVLLLRGAVAGLLAGSVLGTLLGVARLTGTREISTALAFGLLAVSPVVGALVWLLFQGGLHRAAAAVDTGCGLKDRAVTALDFLGRSEPTAVQELQLEDADRHLSEVDPRRVVPLRAPAALPFALVALALALGLLLWPRRQVVANVPSPLEAIVSAAEDARESLEDLEKAAEQENDPELEKLVKQLQTKIDEMEQPGVDVREALAKLSEMQAALEFQQALYNVGMVDAQMKTLGEAMASTQALEAAGQALQQEKYEKAAQELDQADPKFDRKEAKALKEKLKKAAQAMGQAGLGELSESTDELADSLDSEKLSTDALKKLSNLAKAHGRRKQINDLLKSQCNSLSECKSNCQKNSTAQLRLKKKSTRPTSNWGMSISGNVDGDKTTLGANKRLEQVNGQSGEGPSETETTHSPEGRQIATRQYRDSYQKYRKMTEAALNSEPIPLGHRQTIRKYFELIRPQGEEAEQAESAAKAPAVE